MPLAVWVASGIMAAGALPSVAQAGVFVSYPTPRDQAVQAQLEASVHSFLVNDYDDAVDRGCVAPLSAYHQAVDYDRLLNHAAEVLTTESQAIDDTFKTALVLIFTRLAQASAEAALFVASAPIATEQLAPLALAALSGEKIAKIAKDVGNIISGVGKVAGQIAAWDPGGGTFTFSEPPTDDWDVWSVWSNRIDAAFNAFAVLAPQISGLSEDIASLESTANFLGKLSVGSIVAVAGAIKTLLDIITDLHQLGLDGGAHFGAVFTAYEQYGRLLAELQTSVGAMQTAMDACHPPAKQSGLAAIPDPSQLPQSRCSGLAVSGHVFKEDDTITFTVTGGRHGGCSNTATWSWDVPDVDPVSGCKPNDVTCEGLASPTGGAGSDYVIGCLDGGSNEGGWASCVYYAVVPKGTAVLQGTITDRDGSPVAGVTVNAQGTGDTRGDYDTATGFDGFFAMIVKEGSYLVAPHGGPGGSAPFAPATSNVSLTADDLLTADFVLQAGINMQVSFTQTSVPADGQEVVKGTLAMTQYGKPGDGLDAELTVMPGASPKDALTVAPKATVCSGSTLVWPTGTIAEPIGDPVDVTMDDTGHYDFTITVGTQPGTWTLEATGLNDLGAPSSDPSDASAKAFVDFYTDGSARTGDFVTTFDRIAKKSPALQQLGSNANEMAAQLASLPPEGPLGGLAYAVANGKDGTLLIVYNASDPPPTTNDKGLVSAAPGDIVLDPQEWTGAGLPSSVPNPTSLYSVMQEGALPGAPTVEQWSSGASLEAWKLAKGNILTLWSGNFQWYGWAYPGITTAGACY